MGVISITYNYIGYTTLQQLYAGYNSIHALPGFSEERGSRVNDSVDVVRESLERVGTASYESNGNLAFFTKETTVNCQTIITEAGDVEAYVAAANPYRLSSATWQAHSWPLSQVNHPCSPF